MNPVTVGASAPPRYPPKFWMEPKDAVQWAGAATEARAHDMPLAPPAKKTAAEMAITATTLLGVSAATKVNAAIATRPTMIGSLRELIGENPPAISLSVIQPAPMLPTTPQAYGMAATKGRERARRLVLAAKFFWGNTRGEGQR